MILTVTKMTFQKLKPRIINYRDYKHFNNERFRCDLMSELSNTKLEFNNNSFTEFFNICRSTLDQHAPRKQKHARGNHMPFMNKTLSKEIMKRTKLRNKFLKERNDENRKRYTSQRNYCVSLLNKTKKDYYRNLNEKDVSDNKTVWKTVKPFLSDKIVSKEQILLVESDETISEETEIAETLNSFFSNIVKNLKIPEYKPHNDSLHENVSDPIIKIILKYRYHPSIFTIGEVCKKKPQQLLISFSQVTKADILKEILSLDTSKASQDTDIPTKILKENADIFSDFSFANYNATVVENSAFPSILKLADITPVFKKGDKDCKNNYRPVSILSNVSKIFEKMIFRQISSYMESFLSKYQTGFRKGYSTQQCLLTMLEKWKRAVDNGKVFGILLTDLSKAFDCLSHELLLAKLHAYGFSISALRLIHSYLTNRKQRTKINSSYSSWEEILFGVPQGSILGPLLFNIFLCDMFFELSETEFASYADDNTPYVEGDNIDEVIKKLENDSIRLFKWFSDNQMKANKDKCHLVTSTNNKVFMKIDDIEIESTSSEKLLGIKIDSNLNFNEHLDEIIKKASRKVNVLSRITPYMNLAKRKLLMNSFFTSQFNYCRCFIVALSTTK